MKHNTAEVAQLRPEYLGFIFYEKSPRNFNGEIPKLPTEIKKVGVFVNASLEEVLEKVNMYNLDVVQLHGDESIEFCNSLPLGSAQGECLSEIGKNKKVEIWKVFSIKDEFDFNTLKPYENIVDKFLFDTKGQKKGGTGKTFNWKVLKEYSSQKPFILSGGIGLQEIDALKKLLISGLPIHALDVNSRFETEAGMKNIEDLESFIQSMKIKD